MCIRDRLLTAKPNKRMLYEFDHYMDDPLPGTLPSGTVLVDEPCLLYTSRCV